MRIARWHKAVLLGVSIFVMEVLLESCSKSAPPHALDDAAAAAQRASEAMKSEPGARSSEPLGAASTNADSTPENAKPSP